MKSETGLICPVCRGELVSDGRVMRCGRGHSYDIAKQGYVNLLMSNKTSAKRHGDDRAMIDARTRFLEKGHYDCLREAVCRAALKYPAENVDLLDAGCGEGWYTVSLASAFEKAGRECRICGIDISRDALIAFSKRRSGAVLAVAGVNSLPVADRSRDIILNVFAPEDPDEFARVLKPGGYLIKAVPLEDHLMGLKRAVYDDPYPNKVTEWDHPAFREVEKTEVRGRLTLTGKDDIRDLFLMTPYYYKTGREDQQKLLTLDRLETEISFRVTVFKKE